MNSRIARIATAFAVLGLTAVAYAERGTDPQQFPPGARLGMVDVSYVEPADPAHKPIYDRLRRRLALEELSEFLSPLKLKRRLRVAVQTCKQANAFYSAAKSQVTICYEYLDLMRKRAPTATTPEGVTFEDAVIAGFVGVTLHEVAHAVIDILGLPVLGREEDAADQLAAFVMLQFGKNVARRTIAGKAHLWDFAGSKRKARQKRDYSDVHGTEYQRFYNILCIAYGYDPKTFEDFVQKNILPPGRARRCRAEYHKVERAFRMLILPHVDREAMERVRRVDWLRPDDGKPDP